VSAVHGLQRMTLVGAPLVADNPSYVKYHWIKESGLRGRDSRYSPSPARISSDGAK
jgi:hypothetical protein